MSKEAKVFGAWPECDLGPGPMGLGWECTLPAEYDFKTSFGPWAYGCRAHWIQYRATPKLGTGLGQKLVAGKEDE